MMGLRAVRMPSVLAACNTSITGHSSTDAMSHAPSRIHWGARLHRLLAFATDSSYRFHQALTAAQSRGQILMAFATRQVRQIWPAARPDKSLLIPVFSTPRRASPPGPRQVCCVAWERLTAEEPIQSTSTHISFFPHVGCRARGAVRVQCSATRPAQGATRRQALQQGVMLAASFAAW